MTNVVMKDWGELVFGHGGEVKARSAWGEFTLPVDVYARALRIDRKFPGNYSKDGGYLGAWCRHQWSKQ